MSSRIRGVVGVGTRFWFRDLHDAVTPSGNPVGGYREEWWTFYPYVGLETKEPDEPGWSFFGSTRFGLTPLTYQHITDCVGGFDDTLYPRCGITAQAQFGVRYQRFWIGSYVEYANWASLISIEMPISPAPKYLPSAVSSAIRSNSAPT